MKLISRTRRKLYRAGSILGDVDAITSGSPKRVARRAYNRTLWKVLGQLFSRGAWRP